MSQNQITRRFAIRAARTPKKPGVISVPLSLVRTGGGDEEDEDIGTRKRRRKASGSTVSQIEVVREDKEFTHGLTVEGAKAAFQDLMEKRARSNEQLFRLSVHSNSSISAAGIRSILQEWERNGWVPDVVCIDYADILAPPPGQMESRDAINATWKALRSLSQDCHCLVATATQADAASYTADTIGRENFSEDKRKLAHCTAMIGLNSTDPEKKQGLMRLNWIVLREDEFITSKCVHVAGCLSLGNPAVMSVF